MSDRDLSSPTIYAISIDWFDAADGSDGGYDGYGNFVIPSAMREIVDLRSKIKAADVNKECPGPGKCNDPGCPAFYAHESPVKGEQG